VRGRSGAQRNGCRLEGLVLLPVLYYPLGMSTKPLRAALYSRVSTFDQEPENQLRELRTYVQARGWDAREFVDRGVSGSKDSRPALDQLVKEVKRRRVDVVVVWRLDRLGRSLRHLVTLVEELNAVGVCLVSLGEAIDTTTPAGRLELLLSFTLFRS